MESSKTQRSLCELAYFTQTADTWLSLVIPLTLTPAIIPCSMTVTRGVSETDLGWCWWVWLGGYLLILFSPSGKLVQIEYALQAVAAGAPSMGIKAKNGVVLAVEKKQKSFLYDESSITKVSPPLFMEWWWCCCCCCCCCRSSCCWYCPL